MSVTGTPVSGVVSGVPTFGVNAAALRSHYFPSLAAFSTTTKPTAASAVEMIERASARLVGALLAQGITASTISADAGATYPVAYTWCQDTILLGAAIRVMHAISGAGAVPTHWHDDLEARYKYLEAKGYVVLGDAPTPSQNAAGPRSHISNHSIDVGSTTLISDAIPNFRRDDEL